jgi:zinc protease
VIEKYFRPENSVTAALMPVGKKDQAKDKEPGHAEEAGIPQIEKTILPNGLTLLLREDHSTETVYIRLMTMGGARAEDDSNTGITNLMASAMLKGTTSRSAEEIAYEIESRGGSINSFSGHNSFVFELDMLSRDVDIGMEILTDVIANPSFKEEIVEREKEAALASIKRVDDEIFSASMKFFRKNMFKGHPYSFLRQGEAKVVQSITPAQLKKFHSESAVASRMVLSVFGDIETERILQTVKSDFGQISRGEKLAPVPLTFPSRMEPDKASKPMNKEQLAIFIGFPGRRVSSPDRYTLEILSSFLNSQGGKLFQTLRDERGLAYAVGAFNILGVDPGSFVLYIMTDPGKKEKAISGMFEVIDDLLRNGLDEEELERTKIEVMGNHAIGLQTNGDVATEASFDELYGLGYNSYSEVDSKIKAVTAENLRRVASDIFDLNRYVLITVGNLGTETE